jgi:hypothetical protein
MSMRQKDMANRLQIFQREIADAGTGIEEHIVVDQHRGGA